MIPNPRVSLVLLFFLSAALGAVVRSFQYDRLSQDVGAGLQARTYGQLEARGKRKTKVERGRLYPVKQAHAALYPSNFGMLALESPSDTQSSVNTAILYAEPSQPLARTVLMSKYMPGPEHWVFEHTVVPVEHFEKILDADLEPMESLVQGLRKDFSLDEADNAPPLKPGKSSKVVVQTFTEPHGQFAGCAFRPKSEYQNDPEVLSILDKPVLLLSTPKKSAEAVFVVVADPTPDCDLPTLSVEMFKRLLGRSRGVAAWLWDPKFSGPNCVFEERHFTRNKFELATDQNVRLTHQLITRLRGQLKGRDYLLKPGYSHFSDRADLSGKILILLNKPDAHSREVSVAILSDTLSNHEGSIYATGYWRSFYPNNNETNEWKTKWSKPADSDKWRLQRVSHVAQGDLYRPPKASDHDFFLKPKMIEKLNKELPEELPEPA